MKTLRVLLADDHELVRAGIRVLLEGMAGVEVVAEAGDGRQALTLVEQRHPDLVLADISMPGLNGLDLAARLRKDHPRTRVIMLSMHDGEQYVARALRAGASGYLLKRAARSELEVAVRAVARGETYLSPAMSRYLVQGYVRRGEAAPGPLDRLTVRHREVLQLVAEGCTTKEIAVRLGVSVKTVDKQRTQLMERLDIHDIAGLVRFAIRAGVISPEP